MRTLKELSKHVKEVKQAHDAAVSKCAADLAEAQAELEKARADVAKAIDEGAAKSFADAKAAEEYWHDRTEHLREKAILQPFSVAEYNALIDEVDAAVKAENAPLYARMWELVDEWRGIVKRLLVNAEKAKGIGIDLLNTLPDSERTGAAIAKYKRPFAAAVSSKITTLFNPNNAGGAVEALPARKVVK